MSGFPNLGVSHLGKGEGLPLGAELSGEIFSDFTGLKASKYSPASSSMINLSLELSKVSSAALSSSMSDNVIRYCSSSIFSNFTGCGEGGSKRIISAPAAERLASGTEDGPAAEGRALGTEDGAAGAIASLNV